MQAFFHFPLEPYDKQGVTDQNAVWGLEHPLEF
jgi:hypothetical protein